MTARQVRLLYIAGVILLGLLAAVQTLPPRAVALSAPLSEFSAERALVHVQAIAREPRPFGSASFARARAYVVGELKALGLEQGSKDQLGVEAQRDPAAGNVVARIPGSNARGAVLLVAHLDSVETSPGATDDAAGVAVLLETARALRLGSPLHNSVILLFTAQEEQCCAGATAFISTHPWAKDVRLVINIDAGGLTGPALLTATSSNNRWLIHEYGVGDPHAAGNSAEQVYGESYDDFTQAFRPAGLPGYTFALYWDKRTHTPYDTIENTSLASIQHLGYHALALARYFGNGDLAHMRGQNPIYFDVLRSVLVQYSTGWAFPVALVITLLMGWVTWLGMRSKQVSPRGLVGGVIPLLGSAATAPLLVQILWLVVSRLVVRDKHFEERSFVYQITMELIFICASTAVVVYWRRFMGRRSAPTPSESATGVMALLVAIGVAVSYLAPGFSYLFAWPMLFTVIALGCRFKSPLRTRSLAGALFGVALVIALAATVLTWVPRIVLDMFDLDMSKSYLVGLWVVLFLGMAMSQFDLLSTLGRPDKPQMHGVQVPSGPLLGRPTTR
jgi:hypothetical protein